MTDNVRDHAFSGRMKPSDFNGSLIDLSIPYESMAVARSGSRPEINVIEILGLSRCFACGAWLHSGSRGFQRFAAQRSYRVWILAAGGLKVSCHRKRRHAYGEREPHG